MSWRTCKKKCCVCYNPELDELIYQSKVKLEQLSDNRIKVLYYGYSCDKTAEEKIKTLSNYIHVLEDENRKILLGGKECLNCDNLQRLAEKVRGLTASCDIDERRDLMVDKSGVDAWLVKYPFCASYEKWEKFAYRVCGILNIQVHAEKVECDVDFEIFSKEQVCNLAFDITREQIPCDIIMALSVYRQACDLDFTIKRNLQECKVDFKLLHSEVDCDLDFKTYRKLIECNLSYDVIRTVYENGCSFTIGEGESAQLVSPLNSYPVSGFNFLDTPDLERLKKLGISTENSQYEENPKEFITKIKSDYGKKK